MNRDEIWQQLKDEKETVYGRKMLDVFLAVTTELNANHLVEALDFGYEVNDDMIIKMINSKSYIYFTDTISFPEIINKIISKKKDMGGKLMTTILRLYDPEEIQKLAQKMNLNKMTLDDIHTLFWLKTDNIQDIKENSIEIMSELFGDKLKKFNVKQIFALIEQILTVDTSVGRRLENSLDKLIDTIGGWKSLVEKMMHEKIDNYSIKEKYIQLRIRLNDSASSQYFAKKIIENDKNAMQLAQFFDPNIKAN